MYLGVLGFRAAKDTTNFQFGGVIKAVYHISILSSLNSLSFTVYGNIHWFLLLCFRDVYLVFNFATLTLSNNMRENSFTTYIFVCSYSNYIFTFSKPTNLIKLGSCTSINLSGSLAVAAL